MGYTLLVSLIRKVGQHRVAAIPNRGPAGYRLPGRVPVGFRVGRVSGELFYCVTRPVRVRAGPRHTRCSLGFGGRKPGAPDRVSTCCFAKYYGNIMIMIIYFIINIFLLSQMDEACGPTCGIQGIFSPPARDGCTKLPKSSRLYIPFITPI